MVAELQGRVWLLPDDVQASQIVSVAALLDPDGIDPASHVLTGVAPGLAARLRPGDILWAGEGFGHGSSREAIPRLLVRAGIRLVLAVSFARVFYRNAVNIGLAAAVGHPGNTQDGDEIQVNLVTGDVVNTTRDLRQKLEPVPGMIRRILAEGGLVEYVKVHGSLPRDDPAR